MPRLNPKTYVVTKYQPNQALGQPVPGSCIAGENAIFEVAGYSRIFAGWLYFNEQNANELLAYTVSLTEGSQAAVFSGGTPKNDFAPYQHVLFGDEVYLIQKIDGLNITIDPPASATASGVAVRRIPNLNALTRQIPERVSQYGGNAVRYREEAIFSAGRGPLKINGSAISSPLTATDAPQVAYPTGGGSYSVRPAGFTAPAAPTVTAVAAGTKNMTAQDYTFRVSKKRKGFPGYGRASAPVRVALAAGQQFSVTFAAFDASEGQTQARLWVSRTDDPDGNAWYLYGDFDTVGPHATVEWYDGELTLLYQDDNYPPPPCLFIESVNDALLFISSIGAPDGSGNPTAPGPGVAVAKPNNPEAASPYAYAFVSPAADIVMAKVGKVASRIQDSSIYFGTSQGISLGRFVQSDISPLVIGPSGSMGVSHNYSGVFAYDYFYALSGNTLIRTVDGQNVDIAFSQDIKPDLALIKNARAFLGLDSRNGWVVMFHANDRRGSGGKWQSRAWSYNTLTGAWNTPCALGDGVTADFTVCGCATVGQRLYLITTDGKVYEWDAGRITLSGFIASNFDPFGPSNLRKEVREVQVDGSIEGTIKLYKDLNLNALTYADPAPTHTFVNPGGTPTNTHYSTWRPSFPFKSLAWRLDFTGPGDFRLLNSLTIGVYETPGIVR